MSYLYKTDHWHRSASEGFGYVYEMNINYYYYVFARFKLESIHFYIQRISFPTITNDLTNLRFFRSKWVYLKGLPFQRRTHIQKNTHTHTRTRTHCTALCEWCGVCVFCSILFEIQHCSSIKVLVSLTKKKYTQETFW